MSKGIELKSKRGMGVGRQLRARKWAKDWKWHQEIWEWSAFTIFRMTLKESSVPQPSVTSSVRTTQLNWQSCSQRALDEHIIQVSSFPKPNPCSVVNGGSWLAISTKTGISNLDQILISWNIQCNIHVPAGGLFHTNLHSTSSTIRLFQ